MKKVYLFIGISMLTVLMFEACKKNENNTPTSTTIEISDVKGLNDNLYIAGANRLNGNIPEPADGTYGDTIALKTTDIALSDVDGAFGIEFTHNDVDVDSTLVYLQFDGMDNYFEMVVGKDGKVVQKTTTGMDNFIWCCYKHCGPHGTELKIKGGVTAKTTIQTCKLQKGKTRTESKLNKRNWAKPRKLNIRTYGEYSIGSGEFNSNGVTYTGLCVSVAATQCSSGIDVTITDQAASNFFIIYNMPTANSGSFQFTEFQSAGCNLFALGDVGGTLGLEKPVGGTLTKTGAKSFVFTYYEGGKTITGAGAY